MNKPSRECFPVSLFTYSGRETRGISLLEIILAITFVLLAIVPMFDAFFKNYGLATRRIDHEIGLKLAEATLNTLSAVSFNTLKDPSGGHTVLLHFEAPGVPTQEVPFTIVADSSGANTLAKGEASIKIAKNDFQIRAAVERLFEGAPPGTTIPPPANSPYMVLSYTIPKGEDLNDLDVASETGYVCPDDFLSLHVWVQFLSGKETREVFLTTCKANLLK